MMVLDASVVLDLIIRPSTVPDVDAHCCWHAPSLLDVEIVSGIRGLLLGRHITDEQARLALGDYHDLGIRIWPVEAAMRLRMIDYAHAITAYDAAYVVLAHALAAPLLTRDARLAKAATPHITVELI